MMIFPELSVDLWLSRMSRQVSSILDNFADARCRLLPRVLPTKCWNTFKAVTSATDPLASLCANRWKKRVGVWLLGLTPSVPIAGAGALAVVAYFDYLISGKGEAVIVTLPLVGLYKSDSVVGGQ